MKSVRKALEILDSFTLDIKYQGVTEIATKLGFQKSSVHGLLNTLKDKGYIIYDPKTRKYCLGFKILELSKRISYRLDLRNIALPIMQELAKNCEEDIALNILVEGRRLCVEIVESRYFVRQFVPISRALPLHCSAAGKAMLAFLSNHQIESIIKRYGLPQFTEKTITNEKVLMAELKRIEAQRYAESYEEYGKDAAAIAFPLFDIEGSTIGSLSIQSTVNRITPQTKDHFITEGLKAAEKINLLLQAIA